MSDEVINFVIIEEMQSCDSAVSPAALPRTQSFRAPAGMKEAAGEKAVHEYWLRPFPFALPQNTSFSWFSTKKGN